jgi:uncharacterized protein (TIGR02599 family)
MRGLFLLEAKPRLKAFTLVEMMAATAILSVMLLLIFNITQQTGDAWKNSAAKIESFQNARAAFESMTRRISQATLNPYLDYYDATFKTRGDYAGNPTALAAFQPGKYGRRSDLHFITGKTLLNGGGGLPSQITHSIFFQAPTGYTDDTNYKGLDSTLNAVGYYLEYGPDLFRPAFLSSPGKNRYRLMQLSQPTQSLSVYTAGSSPLEWFTTPLSRDPDPNSLNPRPTLQVAENIVALILRPKRSEKEAITLGELAPQFEYDSRTAAAWSSGKQPVTQHQLPPLVEVIMVAVDEPSFSRFNNPVTAPDLGQASRFQEVQYLEANLQQFENILNAGPSNGVNTKKLRYQIFRSEIPIRAAKWSE